jgi:hypothetical protein
VNAVKEHNLVAVPAIIQGHRILYGYNNVVELAGSLPEDEIPF